MAADRPAIEIRVKVLDEGALLAATLDKVHLDAVALRWVST